MSPSSGEVHIEGSSVLKQSVIAGVLAVSVLGATQPVLGQQDALPEAPKQQAIPSAPTPQALPTQGVTPGLGAGAGTPSTSSGTDSVQTSAPGSTLPSSPAATPDATAQAADDQQAAPDLPAGGQGAAAVTTFITRTNFVEVPFTVKDSKNQLVPGVSWREVRVYENGLRQKLSIYTVDPFPLSVALVIDQSMTFDEMTKVNNSLAALQGAFTPYDEIAVYTYNNGPRERTTFTAAQSARLSAVLDQSKVTGRDPVFYSSGPLSQNVNINNGAENNMMPLVNSNHGTSQSNTINVPKDVHTLNDAILAAGKALSKAGKGRRRIIYVISDGKEYGSQAKTKDVIKYLQTNRIAVYGTLIHTLPQLKGEAFLDRFHLPFEMRDNILPVYAAATGGQIDPEFRQRGIESSFARIAEQVRTQYTLGYYTHEPFIDGKYRKLEVKVMRPNLTVIAKQGYYPTPEDTVPSKAPALQPAGSPTQP